MNHLKIFRKEYSNLFRDIEVQLRDLPRSEVLYCLNIQTALLPFFLHNNEGHWIGNLTNFIREKIQSKGGQASDLFIDNGRLCSYISFFTPEQWAKPGESVLYENEEWIIISMGEEDATIYRRKMIRNVPIDLLSASLVTEEKHYLDLNKDPVSGDHVIASDSRGQFITRADENFSIVKVKESFRYYPHNRIVFQGKTFETFTVKYTPPKKGYRYIPEENHYYIELDEENDYPIIDFAVETEEK